MASGQTGVWGFVSAMLMGIFGTARLEAWLARRRASTSGPSLTGGKRGAQVGSEENAADRVRPNTGVQSTETTDSFATP